MGVNPHVSRFSGRHRPYLNARARCTPSKACGDALPVDDTADAWRVEREQDEQDTAAHLQFHKPSCPTWLLVYSCGRRDLIDGRAASRHAADARVGRWVACVGGGLLRRDLAASGAAETGGTRIRSKNSHFAALHFQISVCAVVLVAGPVSALEQRALLNARRTRVDPARGRRCGRIDLERRRLMP